MRIAVAFTLNLLFFSTFSQGVTVNSASGILSPQFQNEYALKQFSDQYLETSSIEANYIYGIMEAGLGAFASNKDEIGFAGKLALGVELNESGSVSLLFNLGFHPHNFEGEDDVDWLFIPNMEVKPAPFLGLRAGYARVHLSEEYVRVDTLNGIYGAIVLGRGIFRFHLESVFTEDGVERISLSLVTFNTF
jgi:hypothetical protein